MKDTALKVCVVIFLAVSLMHLLRVVFKVNVLIGNFAVPLWFSVIGFIGPFLLALWIFSLLKKRG